MTIRVEAGGQWADIREPGALTASDRDAYEESLEVELSLSVQFGEDLEAAEKRIRGQQQTISVGYKQIHARRNALLAAVIEGWSLGIALPSEDPASVKAIPLVLLDALDEATEPHSAALTSRPKATRSSRSNGGLKAGAGRRTG